MFRRWSFAEGVKEFAAQQEKFAAEECGVSSKILLTSEIVEKTLEIVEIVAQHEKFASQEMRDGG